MYIRSKKNKSGSQSVQIIEKQNGKYIVVETIGLAHDEEELLALQKHAQLRLIELEPQASFPLLSPTDSICRKFLNDTESPIVSNAEPELVLGKIFDAIGLNVIEEEFFRHLVLARLTYPVSKLKTTDYLLQHHGIDVDITSIYRFLDRFHEQYKATVEDIIYKHSKNILGEINMMFYDMTTLYFEAEDEDDLRKIGFSKDGKFQCPQIMIGLLVGADGYPIAYDIFEGNTYEGSTLIPIIEATQKKYNLSKPIIVADSGLLSKSNIKILTENGYSFIIGARIKNETDQIKKQILKRTKNLEHGKSIEIDNKIGRENHRLIISFSDKRARKDSYNRVKGIRRLKAKIASGRLTKESINNRGYNKFLSIDREVKVSLDEQKIEDDKVWDGLKGYVTNTNLRSDEVIQNYNHLWKIERAFRISKTDLRIRPIFHRKRKRIEAHLCIAFTAYAIYKELERRLKRKKLQISAAKAIELTKTIFHVKFTLPESKEKISIYSKVSKEQQSLLEI